MKDTKSLNAPDRAESNIEEWGEQTPTQLVLALAEEVGEIADAVLESQEKPDGDRYASNKAYLRLVDIREAGFEARDFLEANFEDAEGPLPETDRPELLEPGDPERVLDEVADAAPLVYQLAWALQEAEE